jgi:hypothetical protein
MKRILILACISITIAMQSQNTIKFYKVNLKASEILPNGRQWGPSAAGNRTVKFTRAANSINELLGQTYRTTSMKSTEHFLNTDIETFSPLLDSINFSYYISYGFLEAEKFTPALINDSSYKSLKESFIKAKSNLKRREILFAMDNRKFKNILENSRYTTYQPAIKMTISQTNRQMIEAGIAAEMVVDINEYFKLTPKVEGSLKDSLTRKVSLKGGMYHEIKFVDGYIKRAAKILKPLTPITPVSSAIMEEDFYDDYIAYWNDENAGLITGAGVIEAQFDAKKLKSIAGTIGAVVKGDLKPTPEEEEQIASLSAKITAKYTGSREIDQEVQTVQTFYYIRYVYDKRLELGKTKAKQE